MTAAASPIGVGGRARTPARPRWARAGRRAVPWWPATALVVAVGAVVARRPSAVTRPALWAEDGRYWFANAYDQGPWRPLLEPHTGYLQTFPRLVADAGLLLPLRDVPLLFALVAVVVQALPAAVVVSDRFAAVLPSRAGRLALAALYLAVPNSSEVDANLTNAQWHLALVALLCLLAAPGGVAAKVFDVVVTVLSGLTGPFVIVLALVGALWVWRGPRRRWTVGLWATSAVTAVVQAAVLVSRSGPRQPGLAPVGATPGRLVDVVGGQVGLGGVIGAHGLLTLPSSVGARVDLVGLVAVVAVYALVLLRAPFAVRIVALYAVGVLAASLASPVASTTEPQWVALAHDAGGRYWLVPVLAYLVGAAWLAGVAADRLLGLRWPRASGLPGRRPPGARRHHTVLVGGGVLGAAVVVGSVLAGMPADWRYPVAPPVDAKAAFSAFSRARAGQAVTIPIEPPGWTMVLVKR